MRIASGITRESKNNSERKKAEHIIGVVQMNVYRVMLCNSTRCQAAQYDQDKLYVGAG